MARFFRKRRRADLQHQLLSVYGLGSIVCETRTAKDREAPTCHVYAKLLHTTAYLLRCGLHVPDDLHFSRPRPRSSRERSANATELRKAIVTGRLRLKMQKIHRVNLVRLNLLKSREIIERH